ncbi:MAG: nucleotidyltransferase domain-containing protein [bacterium]
MDKHLNDSLKALFKEKNWVDLAFLFGSQSKGKGGAESDFDVAIWPAEKTEEKNIDKLWLELEKTLKKPVDLVNLPSASPLVAWKAFQGIPLLVKDRRFYLNKMLEISSEAEDLNNFITDVWHAREAKGK